MWVAQGVPSTLRTALPLEEPLNIMQKIIYIKDYQENRKGIVGEVSNNMAHALVELGVAVIYKKGMEKVLRNIAKKEAKALRKPPVDKMMKPEEDKGIEKGRYVIK
uniref:Uncharacterized protein n=1 Tax=viral metagenome TaxID=1070528 RepID=A0A6M3MDC6_9ZZZZ